jgi:hypothetical protein
MSPDSKLEQCQQMLIKVNLLVDTRYIHYVTSCTHVLQGMTKLYYLLVTTITQNKNKHNKAKGHLNTKPHSETGGSDFVHIPRNKICKVFHQNIGAIHFSYVNSVTTYGIIFWGNSPHSFNIFKIQKCMIRIMINAKTGDSCRKLLKT